MAMGAVIWGDEHDGGAGCGGGVLGVVAGEGDGGEDELAAALDDETGEPRPGVCCAELDEVEVAVELLPVVGEDASACVGLVAGVFCAICACLAVGDGALCGLGDGMAVVGVLGGCEGGVGGEEALCLFEAFAGRGEVLAEELGLAVAGGEEVGELGVGLDAVRGGGRHGRDGVQTRMGRA